MTTMTLNVPEALEKEHDRTVQLIATKLYEAGEVTLGQAAEMAGMKKWTLPCLPGKSQANEFQTIYLCY